MPRFRQAGQPSDAASFSFQQYSATDVVPLTRLLALLLLAGLHSAAMSTALAEEVATPTTAAAATGGTPEAAPVSLGEFSLPDYQSVVWTRADFADKPVLVIAFLGTECPLAQHYAHVLEGISRDYADRQVAIVGVNANPQDSLSELAQQVKREELSYPMLKDVQQTLLLRLAAKRTPEVFVFDASRTLRYRGRIDDQHSIGGKSKREPSRRDLCRALDDLLAGQPVEVALTEPVGCLVETLGEPDPTASVTYSNQISRLLQKHCVECHRPGEVAPFSLTNYEDARGWSEMIWEVTRQKRMPPWHASPEFGHFRNERRLSAEEQQLIAEWVKSGAPLGDPSQQPEPLAYTPGWQLPREPDLIIPMADEPYLVPATGTVDYQHFVADSGLTEDRWIQAAEIVPSNRAVVHHVIVFASPDGKFFDGERQFLMAYVPGLRVQPYAPGMAKKIPAGSKLIFQVHYTPNGTEREDLTRIGLIFADPATLTHEIRTESVMSRKFVIEPNLDNQQFETKVATAPVPVQLLSMSPHMHVRGKSFRYELTWPDGRVETLLDVPNYDFNWQTAYILDQPLNIPAGAKLKGYGAFDNSPNNLANPDPSQQVRWGDQSWEEMLLGYFDIAIPLAAPVTTGQLMTDRSAEQFVANLIRTLDKNGDGTLQVNEVPIKFQAGFSKGDRNQDGQIDDGELIAVLPKLRDAIKAAANGTLTAP